MQTSLENSRLPVLPGTLVDGRLRLERKIGVGGMGEVFLATSKTLPDVRFAVKVLRREFVESQRLVSLEAEARTQSVLSHDNIVRVFELVSWGGNTFLVMDYVDGESLQQRIAEHPRGLEEGEALELMAGILRGLNHAHESGVLHCDVKPGNVMLDKQGRPRITDFGIARNLGLSGTQFIVGGSPAYMSPEQIARHDSIDHRSDVYSCGIMLFEMFTGQLPFDEKGGELYPQLTQPPLRLRALRPEYDGELEAIVAKAIEFEPGLRYQGCLDFLDAIEKRLARQRWRRRWLPAIVIVLAAAILVPVVLYWYKDQAAQQVEQIRRDAQRKAVEARALALRQQNEAIEASIKNAAVSLFSICKDRVRLKDKRAGLAIARQQGMQDLVPKFQLQVNDIEQNLADYAKAYGTAINGLTKFEKGLVGERFSNAANSMSTDARLLGTVRKDTSTGRTTRTWGDLVSECAA